MICDINPYSILISAILDDEAIFNGRHICPCGNSSFLSIPGFGRRWCRSCPSAHPCAVPYTRTCVIDMCWVVARGDSITCSKHNEKIATNTDGIKYHLDNPAIITSVHDYDWNVALPLVVYYDDGRCKRFDKYAIYIWGEVINIRSGSVLEFQKTDSDYHIAAVYYKNERKQQNINIARAVLSSFYGRPPLGHTADHLDNTNKNYNALYELKWSSAGQQAKNRKKRDDLRSAFIIVKDGVEKTAKEWARIEKKSADAIKKRAQYKIMGFSYKEYPDLAGEKWKIVPGSKTTMGQYREISNMNRCAYVSKNTRVVNDVGDLCLTTGYPVIGINDNNEYVHITSFRTWYPDLWDAKKENENVLHRNDNKLDFRPENLYLGTHSRNGLDCHDNGKRSGTKTARRPCISYVNGVFERHHTTLGDAADYLKTVGYPSAWGPNIGISLDAYNDGKTRIRYGRTWKPAE